MEQSILNESVDISDIRIFNECSKTTVYEDIDYLSENWGDILDIRTDRTRFSVHNRAMADFQYVKHELLRNEIGISTFMFIFLHPHSSMYDIVDHVNYSESHVRKQIYRINKFLVPFMSTIEYDTSNKTYSITSKNETFLHYLVIEIIKLTSYTDLPELSDEHKATLDQIFNGIFKYFPSDTVNNFSMLYRTALIRIDQKMYFEEEPIYDYLKSIEKIYTTNIIPDSRTYIDTKFRDFFISNDISLPDEELKKIIDIIVGIILRAYIYPERVDTFVNRYDIFYHQFTEINPFFSDAFTTLLIDFKEKHGVDVTDYTGEILFQIYTNVQDLRKYRHFEVAIYSDIGKEHEDSMILTFKKHFPLQHISSYDPNKSYDITLTTSKLRFEGVETCGEVFAISDIIGNRDLSQLYEALYQINYTKSFLDWNSYVNKK